MEETRQPLDPKRLLSHREWIRGLARNLVNDDATADDVAQEALATALTARPPVLRSLRAWLAVVTRSRALDHRRSESARVLREQSVRPRSVPSTADLVARADAQRAVAAAVMDLAEPYRTTVLLRHFEDLTPTEIGERTGVPRETVKTRLRRAHVLLRERLDDEFGGERARWRAALLPLLGPLVPLPPTPTPADGPPPARPGLPEVLVTTAGALAMTLKSKLAAVAVVALLLLAGGAAVSVLQDDAPGGVSDAGPDQNVGTAPTEQAIDESDEATPARTLVGYVRRRADGAPVANVALALETRSGRTVHTITTSDGSFALDAPAGVLGSLDVQMHGYARELVAVPQTSDDLGTLWIESAARLVVRVEDTHGAPVGGVGVVATRRPRDGDRAHVDSFLQGMTASNTEIRETLQVRSDGTGNAVFERARPGLWQVAASGDGLGTQRSAWVSVVAGAPEVRATIVVAPLVSLSGRVLDAAGETVADALVIAGRGGSAEQRVRSDPSGRFQLTNLPTGAVTLSVDRGPGPGAQLAVVRVPDVPSVDLVLAPTGRLAGRVTDEDGRGLAGETVNVQVDGSATTVTTALTDTDGRYEFAALPVGTIGRFRVFSDERVQVWPRFERGELVRQSAGAPQRERGVIVAGATTTIDAVLGRGGVIVGTVTGPDGPVPGVQIWRWRKPARNGQNWASTTTDDDGAFRFPPDLPGPVTLQVRHASLFQPGLPEHVSRALSRDEVTEEFIVEIPERGEVAMDLRVVSGGPVRGRVHDESGAAVSNAVVLLFAGEGRRLGLGTRSDAEGRFVFPHVRPGQAHSLQATTPDESATGVVNIDVPAGGVAEEIVVCVLLGEASAAENAERVLTGRALFVNSGRPVTGANVVLLPRQPMLVRGVRAKDRWRNEPIIAVTDADGRFSCALRGPGPHWLSAESNDAVEEVVEIAGTADTVELRLRRSMTISGHVRDVDGSALAGATVIAVSRHRRDQSELAVLGTPTAATAEGRPGEARAGSDGRFIIHGVPEGPCKINVFRAESLADYATAMQAKPTAFGPFDAGAEGLDLRLDRPQRASLRLRVVRPDGSAVTQASIRYVPDGALHGGFVNLIADDGRVTIPDAADPTYSVRVTAHAEPRTTGVFRALVPGETEHELVLSGGASISGRVVDLSGAPVAGITVDAQLTGPYDFLGNFSAATDADGAFMLAGLEPARYELKTSSAATGGWRRLVERVFVAAGESGVTLRTSLEGRVSGVVVDTQGRQLPGVRVYFYRPPAQGVSGAVPHTTTDDAGRFTMTGLDPACEWSAEPQVDGNDHVLERKLRVVVSIGDDAVRLVVPAKD